MTTIDYKISGLPAATEPVAGNDLLAVTNVSAPGTGKTEKRTQDELLASQLNLNFRTATELTISSGAITVTQSNHKLQPESGTTDDLTTINGMTAGKILVLYVSDAGTDTITIKHGTGNISCLGATDVALSHGSAIFYSDGTTVYLIGGGGGGESETIDYLCQGRLTLETGVPISTSDQVDKITLYFTPFNGNIIDLYDGSSTWVRHTFTEKSLDISAFTASKPYDIFIYDNAGTLTLSATAWTDATTRATALTTQDGVYVKSGATNYRYLGTIYIDAGQKCQDTEAQRFVYNEYNQADRKLKAIESTDNWVYTSTTWREANGVTTLGVTRVAIVCGNPVYVKASVYGACTNSSLANVSTRVGIGINKTTANDADIKAIGQPTAVGTVQNVFSYYNGYLTAGYNYLQWTEKSNTGGTNSFLGDSGNSADNQYGLLVEVKI